ncbi:MAG TPA: substrate-binding domain-containing protein [Opitutaceae bacterium]|nr:substrate-binding domain-containing protein [Opitutaceae bacterium]
MRSSPFSFLTRFLTALLPFALGVAAVLQASPEPSEVTAYSPQPVELPKNAGYVLSDGSIYVVGNDGMEGMLNKFNDLFVKTHPGFKFKMLLKGSSTGIGGLTAGVSAFAPMGREAWPTELSGFREAYEYLPLDIHVGYDGYGPRPKYKTPPGIYVSAKSPLNGLTVEQVTRIFTTGSAKGNITHWGQLGVTGGWANRVIHLYGPPDDGGLATSTRITHMGKLPFAQSYETIGKGAEIAKAVSEDPYGIALIGFFDAANQPGIKLVPLAETNGSAFSLPTYENVHEGKYPYVPFMHFYVNRAPGKPLDAFVREYLRLVLSREGQAIIAEEKETEEGYVPLNPAEIAKELAKLN